VTLNKKYTNSLANIKKAHEFVFFYRTLYQNKRESVIQILNRSNFRHKEICLQKEVSLSSVSFFAKYNSELRDDTILLYINLLKLL
jgi:hypothetical protein